MSMSREKSYLLYSSLAEIVFIAEPVSILPKTFLGFATLV